MEKHYNTVIIGGGPAGASCGIELRKRGIKCIIIDKAAFPREKTCAGIVTGKTEELLRDLLQKEDVSNLFCYKTNLVKIYNHMDHLVTAKTGKRMGFVDRVFFDNYLIGKYKELDGEIRENAGRYVIDRSDNLVAFINGDIIRYDNLVMADGALGQYTKFFGAGIKKLAFGIETFIPSDEWYSSNPGCEYEEEIYFGEIKGGYIWAFPHGESVCVGAINIYNKKTNYKNLLSSFLDKKGIDLKKATFHGAFLPYGARIKQEYLQGRVFLVGDAGGFTDPISGEGLYMSLFTGICAAGVISGNKDKEEFLAEVKKLQKLIKEGRRLRWIFYHPLFKKIFVKKVKDNNKFVAYFFDHQVEHYGYDYGNILKLYKDYKNEYRG